VTKKSDSEGRTEYFVEVVKSIDARKRAEVALSELRTALEKRVEERTAELAGIIENANDAYISLDESGKVIGWNKRAMDTFGWAAEEALGRNLDELIMKTGHAVRHRAGIARYLATGVARVLNQRLELPALRKDRTEIIVEVRIHSVQINGETRFSAFLHDISERKAQEALREAEAKVDALTGLANRRAFLEALPASMSRADRTNRSLAVIFIDLDGFKSVNDEYGHESGDLLLKEIGMRIRRVIRDTDYAARLGGDEFTIIVEGVERGQEDARIVAVKLRGAITQPVDCASGQLRVGASIGIAVYQPRSEVSPENVVSQADEWMYQAKKAGNSSIMP
jgi:diguanylate cyclase (GGDEF)-like protein/PAS domain S-box-containing protein